MACPICGGEARKNLSLAASQMGHGNALDADHYLGRAQMHQSLADTHSVEDHAVHRNGQPTVFVDHRGNHF